MILLPILILIASFFAYQQFSRDGINNSRTSIVEHATLGPLNNDNCRVLHNILASEDVAVEPSGKLAYLSSGSEQDRLKWFPGLGHFNTKVPIPEESSSDNNKKTNPYRNDVYLFDVATENFQKLKVVGYDKKDLVIHGMSVKTWTPGVNTLYMVNHQRTGSIISVFEHTPGATGKPSNVIEHVVDIKDPHIRSPNSVIALSPSQILVTNDYGHPRGVLRTLESIWNFKLGTYRGSEVVMCDFDPSSASSSKVSCKYAAKNLSYANGIEYIESTKVPGTGKVFVTQTTRGTIAFFDYNAIGDNGTGELTQTKELVIGAGLDNIRLIPGTRDLTVATFPNPETVFNYLTQQMKEMAKREKSTGVDVVDVEEKVAVPAMAIVLKESDNYSIPHRVFQDEGKVPPSLGFLTGMIFVPEAGKFLAGSCLQEGFVVCDIDYSSI